MEQQPRAANPTVGTVGKLKIFFGYGDGVGKTYAMLQQALQDQTMLVLGRTRDLQKCFRI